MDRPRAASVRARPGRRKLLPLQRKASQIGAALLFFLAAGILLRFAGDGICGLFARGASLANPAGTPDFAVELIRLGILLISLGLPILFLRYLCRPTSSEKGLLLRVDENAVTVWVTLFLPVIVAAIFCSSFLRFSLGFLFSFSPPAAAVLPAGGFALLLSFFNICALPAFFEELLFRGCIQGALLPYGQRFAILTASVLFTLLHADVSQLPGTFFLSYFLGWAAAATGGCALSITLHLIYNSTSFLLAYTGQHMMQAAAPMLGIILLVLYLMIGLFFFVRLRRKNALPARPTRVKDPRNRQSRAELLLTTPVFLVCLLSLLAYWILRQLL